MTSILIYMTKQQIFHKNANRLKEDSFKNRPREEHVPPFITVKAKQHIRLNDPQLCIEFFTFPSRFCDFQRYHLILNRAIEKLGRFSFVYFLSKINFDQNENLSKMEYFSNILERVYILIESHT